MGIRDIDKGYNALVGQIFNFSKVKPKVEIGVSSTEQANNAAPGVTVTDIALWMEFGTLTAPERSFLRAWYDENETEILGKLRSLVAQVLAGKLNRDAALDIFGQWGASEIRRRMLAGVPPPNARSTVRRKGSSTPLIDTKQLLNAVQHKVKYGNSEG